MRLHTASIWRWLIIIGLIAACLASLVGPAQAATRHQATAACGVWTVQPPALPKDHRLAAELVSGPTGSDCQGLFHVTNATQFHGQGGYALELTPSSANARSELAPVGDSNGKTILLPPPLDIDIHAFPLDKSLGAKVYVNGEPTPQSLLVDTSFFLLNAFIDAIGLPTKCVISPQQISFISFRNSSILEPVVTLALKGNLPGAVNEFSPRISEFVQQAIGYLIDAGVGCAVDKIKKAIGKPAVVAKIVAEFMVWIPVVLFDYFKYQGQAASMTLTYTPATPKSTPTSSAARNSEAFIYVGVDGNLWLSDLTATSQRPLTAGGGYAAPAISPDGRRVAYIHFPGADGSGQDKPEVGILDLDSSQEVILIPPEKNPFGPPPAYYQFGNPRWSPDGTALYIIASDGRVTGNIARKYDSSSGRMDMQFHQFNSRGMDVSWVSGSVISVDFSNSDPVGYGLSTFGADGSRMRSFLPVTDVYIGTPRWSPTGVEVAFVASGGQYGSESIVVSSEDGISSRILVRAEGLTALTWADGGNAIIYEAIGKLRMLSIGNGIFHDLFAGHEPTGPLSLPIATRTPPAPAPTPTRASPQTPVPTGVASIADVWEGTATNNACFQCNPVQTHPVSFEVGLICSSGSACLKGQSAVVSELPLVDCSKLRWQSPLPNNTVCFGDPSATGFPYYGVYLFNPQPDGTMQFVRPVPDGDEAGILHRVSAPASTPAPNITLGSGNTACAGAFGNRLRAGDTARVIVYQIGVRDEPGGPGYGHRVNVLAANRLIKVLEGPVCVNGLYFVLVRSDSGVEGWVAEGDNENYYLAPVK